MANDDYEYEIVDPLGPDYSPESSEEDGITVAKLDEEKYDKSVVEAYAKIMEVAEADPNASSYDADEMEDL